MQNKFISYWGPFPGVYIHPISKFLILKFSSILCSVLSWNHLSQVLCLQGISFLFIIWRRPWNLCWELH